MPYDLIGIQLNVEIKIKNFLCKENTTMKIAIIADAYALTSSIKAKEIELLKKYNPSALKVCDEEGNEKFSVGYVAGKPSVVGFGITFGGKNADDEVTVTEIIPSGTADAKEFIADRFGAIIPYLKQLEETVPAEAKKVADNKKAIIDSIKTL